MLRSVQIFALVSAQRPSPHHRHRTPRRSNAAGFTAHAKANPGRISWASPGVGTVPHLAGELFKRRAGIEMTQVPYRGVTEGLMADFIAGRLDLMFI